MPQPASRTALLIPLLLGSTALPALGASFDCAKAQTWAEQALCNDETLGQLDERLDAAYRAAREAAKGDAATLERLLSRQRAWLAEREGCKITPCLTRLYEQRLAELTGTGGAPQDKPLEQKKIQESGPHFTIDAAYPVLPGDGPAVAEANRQIRGTVDEVVVDFRGRIDELTAGSGTEGEGWQGPDWSLSIDYETPHQTSRYLAIPLTGYEYTGGAHGMPLILPLVIDLSTGRPIPPEGLFKPGSDWLEQLSQRCRSELEGRDLLGDDGEWLREGTAPKLENFSLLFPGPDGLTVTFAPYSVAPYAAGAQEVLIPYQDLDQDLAGLLSPEVFGP
jgi:uncharacterized protein